MMEIIRYLIYLSGLIACAVMETDPNMYLNLIILGEVLMAHNRIRANEKKDEK